MTDTAELFIDSRCLLGEGPFWHPTRKRLFWFDIINQTLFMADTAGQIEERFVFKDVVSAAGVIDTDTLCIAMGGAFIRFDIETDSHTVIHPLEADKPGNRPNDGRVNPAGGFWIGTMSRKGGMAGAGTLYQFRGGHLDVIQAGVNIPNSTCFSPDGRWAYFTHNEAMIKKIEIDPATGLPVGEWIDFVSTVGHRGVPDGSVVDSEGYLWNARWNGSCVVRHAPDGSIDRVIDVPAPRVTCPAFGGDDLKTLYLTTAREGMTPAELEQYPHAGSVFSIRVDVPGLPETPIKL